MSKNTDTFTDFFEDYSRSDVPSLYKTIFSTLLGGVSAITYFSAAKRLFQYIPRATIENFFDKFKYPQYSTFVASLLGAASLYVSEAVDLNTAALVPVTVFTSINLLQTFAIAYKHNAPSQRDVQISQIHSRSSRKSQEIREKYALNSTSISPESKKARSNPSLILVNESSKKFATFEKTKLALMLITGGGTAYFFYTFLDNQQPVQTAILSEVAMNVVDLVSTGIFACVSKCGPRETDLTEPLNYSPA